ncbi:hypothetical protein L228DRAFT_259400 [Xylona heveae TC161]|uniref:Uncharacterized protein n=1 Tax=Xylona heveae (strain CBS 132557 / TC161) TaxID=1328760 RepID=A0A165HZK9_XYLHT|nr:hypothetical protein L228DRAFT_259400 [Xylona heveae TC161]KZF24142.1 hypothetical protein L228DRAFT_259400 [Xylona heveae TC161]
MADWKEFRDRAKQLKPDEAIKPTSYWVGILKHEKEPSQALAENDFVWAKCHGRITFQTLKAEYEKLHFVGETVILKDGFAEISDKTTVAEADLYSDRHIIVRASKAASVFKHEEVEAQPLD